VLTESTSDDRIAAAQFRALLASTSQGIIGVDSAGTIQLVNSKAEALFGYARGELKGQPIEVLVPECVRTIHAEEVRAYCECPRPRPMGVGVELKGRRRDGSEFPVEISLNHVRAGGKDMIISLISDISERTEMEEHLRQARKMEAVGELAGGLAHEFNNLLTVISGYTRLLLDRCQGDEVSSSSLERISTAAERAATLTRQLLTFSRSQIIQPMWFGPNQRLSQMQGLLCHVLGDDIELELALGDDLGEFLADPQQFDQVILNLVQNARDAMPEGGLLTIETAAVEVGEMDPHPQPSASPGPHIKLILTDTGVGMTPEVQERIFEPFFTTKPQGQGTGFGLAAVYGIVRDSGGSISVSSKPNHGSRFQMILPRIWESAVVLHLDRKE